MSLMVLHLVLIWIDGGKCNNYNTYSSPLTIEWE
jgi:uncharacterized Tic20 family protein